MQLPGLYPQDLRPRFSLPRADIRIYADDPLRVAEGQGLLGEGDRQGRLQQGGAAGLLMWGEFRFLWKLRKIPLLRVIQDRTGRDRL